MKFLCCFFFSLFFAISSVGQTSNLNKNSFEYLNNIKSEKEKLQRILNIPFDEATKNFNAYDSIIDYGIKTSLKIKDSVFLAQFFERKALTLHFTSKEEEAFTNSIKAVDIYKKLNLTLKLGNAYLDYGWKLKNRDLNAAITYMQKGIAILEKENKTTQNLIAGYNNYGVLHNYKNQLDSATFYHKKSLSLAKKLNDSISIPFAHTHIASVLIKKKSFKLAKKYLDSSLIIRKLRKDTYGITDSELYLGDLFFEKRSFKTAINHFKKAYQLAKQNQYYPLQKYASELLFKSFDSLSNFKKALFYHKVFTKMKDSVLNKNTNDKISELNIKFNTAEKEKKISLQKEEILENELKIKNKNLFVTLLVAGILILGIIFFSIYKRNQLKRIQLQKEIDLKDALSVIKTQNRLQEQRLRISRDLHDNIGSQLTFIISSIDNLKFITKDTNQKLKEKLANISHFTADTIFQLRDTIWAMNKSQVTFNDLHSRTLSFIEKAKTAKPNITFSANLDVDDAVSFTSIQGMNIFRVIQEAISNAIKYADASEILLKAYQENNTIHILIKDNGIGFDINKIDLGNGLSNMEKRMNEIGGNVLINSNLNKGTEIKFTIKTNILL